MKTKAKPLFPNRKFMKRDKVKLPFNCEGVITSITKGMNWFPYKVRITKGSAIYNKGEYEDFKDEQLTLIERPVIKDKSMKTKLQDIFNVLDEYLGDTDPDIDDDMTDDEIKECEPLFWCAKEIMGLIK